MLKSVLKRVTKTLRRIDWADLTMIVIGLITTIFMILIGVLMIVLLIRLIAYFG